MLLVALTALWAVAQPGCSPEARLRLDRARIMAAELDLPGAAGQLDYETVRACELAYVAALYVHGLVDAQEAFRQGAPPESLEPVRGAAAALEVIADGRPGTASLARLLLQAAAAAAQSERDEMRLYLDAAIQMESLQQAVGQPAAPLVSAAELAGDLWLQVHRYEEARQAYEEAATRVGFTHRVLAGLARAARRLDDAPAACLGFRRLLASWGARPELPPEIVEARTFAAGCVMANP